VRSGRVHGHGVKILYYWNKIEYATLEDNSKVFFQQMSYLGGGVILDFNKYIFPWQLCFIWTAILDYFVSTVNIYYNF
jgi:hypothetical protein